MGCYRVLIWASDGDVGSVPVGQYHQSFDSREGVEDKGRNDDDGFAGRRPVDVVDFQLHVPVPSVSHFTDNRWQGNESVLLFGCRADIRVLDNVFYRFDLILLFHLDIL